MGIRTIIGGAFAALVLGAGGVLAKDLVLMVGNENYRNFNEVPNAQSVLRTSRAFEAAGYEVTQLSDASEARLKDAFDQFERLHGDADRVVVVLAGQFMKAQSGTWFAPTDLQSPSLSNIAFDAMPLSAILSFLGEKPGGAALFLAQVKPHSPVDAPIQKGVGPLQIPQGVMVAEGTPINVQKALIDAFLQPDVSLAEAVEASPKLKVSGFVSDWVSLNGTLDTDIEEEVVVDLGVSAALAEEAFWQAADAIGSKASYETYLRRYPLGEFAEQAQQMLQVIADATPKYTPEEQAELDMALTRNDRRRVQEQLSLLGFNPRGIDGLFGPGSRAAIKRFQSLNGLVGGGFMNPMTLRLLRNQSETRAAELAEEAERENRRRDAADAKLWERTGARGTEADYLAYLSKYPKGLYSTAARKELQRIEEEKNASAKAVEKAAWDEAKAEDTVPAYRRFIGAYPDGSFTQLAIARIDQLTATDEENAERAAAKREEEALRMSPSMMLLIERKLKAIGLKPGKQDGNFTKNTRAAIRDYQNARGLPVTGFVTRRTVVRLMSE